MAEKLTDAQIYEQARKRVKEKKDFFVHFVVYAVVNLVLVFIWGVTMNWHGYPWFMWPMFGWGIGVVFHGLSVFFFDRETGWERSEIEKEAARLKQGQK
jgi:hypothetical protein